MVNIVHTRLDDRYIHGQVATGWIPHTQSNLVVICNDAVAEDEMRKQLISIAAPEGVGVRYFSVQKTIDVIHQASQKQHILLMTDNPLDALKLVENGVPIKEINLGNRAWSAEHDIKVYKSYHVSSEEKAALDTLVSKGITVYYALTPNDSKQVYKG
ncbi:PTS sugar transporter subunit IIB [Citrobacter sp. S2-9]|uniref:PTS sugar transporter subunit IIB n=1 Tax=Citrobacter enshiensis TaxID=2971264 RepID=A0ABT8Q113_9ENTR|nr:PTS sugar transporter subunit IIB [Citrobacter enshiensis]MDN8601953.1 PTS sugar transporter subunit IIB [Citrobacter enshiensis]